MKEYLKELPILLLLLAVTSALVYWLILSLDLMIKQSKYSLDIISRLIYNNNISNKQ